MVSKLNYASKAEEKKTWEGLKSNLHKPLMSILTDWIRNFRLGFSYKYLLIRNISVKGEETVH